VIRVEFQDAEVREIVTKALFRSFTRSQITSNGEPASILFAEQSQAGFKKQVLFGPRPVWGSAGKSVLLGAIHDRRIQFTEHPLTRNLHLRERHFERYDFDKEWNNLGYGKIEKTPGTPFSLADTESREYCVLHESPDGSVLWFNRPVGPLDGFDWRIVEDFVSDHGAGALPTLPVLSEIPAGYRGAVTFRIDCDEAIASGRPLFELYRKFDFPFSLAIKTEQEFDPGSLELMNEVLASGGSILIHSHTHAPEWGEPSTRPGPKSRGDAFFEASTAIAILKEKLPGRTNSYAVSPFHQNPRMALPKLVRAGIDGFIGGIICNDPEYLMARGGAVPFCEGMVSHSEQCMFHGDCIHPHGDSLAVYFEALENAIRTETFFGYLDHPFSNYHYGWRSEEARLKAHEEFLIRIRNTPGLLKASSKDTLDFMFDRDQARITWSSDKFRIQFQGERRSSWPMKARLHGKEIRLVQ
jgi:hypothetical protein